MSSPVTALTGMFMLTWAWLGFNCGSTFRITPNYWKVSALVAVTTLNGGIGGGLAGLALSMLFKNGKVDVGYVINSLLGGLVAITGGCPMFTPTESILIGVIGAIVAIGVGEFLEWAHIDDPVGAIPVHFGAALWGTLAIGIFGKNNFLDMMMYDGLLHGGGFKLLAVNALGAVTVISFAGISTFLSFLLLRVTLGIRVSLEEEAIGADFVEHDIQSVSIQDRLENIFKGVEENETDTVVTLLKELIFDLKSDHGDDTRSRPQSGRMMGPMTLPTKAAGGVDLRTLVKLAHEELLDAEKSTQKGMYVAGNHGPRKGSTPGAVSLLQANNWHLEALNDDRTLFANFKQRGSQFDFDNTKPDNYPYDNNRSNGNNINNNITKHKSSEHPGVPDSPASSTGMFKEFAGKLSTGTPLTRITGINVSRLERVEPNGVLPGTQPHILNNGAVAGVNNNSGLEQGPRHRRSNDSGETTRPVSVVSRSLFSGSGRNSVAPERNSNDFI